MQFSHAHPTVACHLADNSVVVIPHDERRARHPKARDDWSNMGCQYSTPYAPRNGKGGTGGRGGGGGSGSLSGGGAAAASIERLKALRNNNKEHLPPPLVDTETGRLHPSEVQKRTTTSQASKLVRLRRNQQDGEILVEVRRMLGNCERIH
jgi:hypothetical protein